MSHLGRRLLLPVTLEATIDEKDVLDTVGAARKRDSRLACQCVPDGSEDIEVEIPAWNRNEVKEGH